MTNYDPWGKSYRPGISDDMKQTHGFGPFYFFALKGYSKLSAPVASRFERGFIREIDPPYRRGNGIQLRYFRRLWGFGLCRKMKYENDYVATREALEASDIIEAPTLIGDWDADYEEQRQGRASAPNGDDAHH